MFHCCFKHASIFGYRFINLTFGNSPLSRNAFKALTVADKVTKQVFLLLSIILRAIQSKKQIYIEHLVVFLLRTASVMTSIDRKKYFVILDLGTTSTRANIIDKNFDIVASARFESKLIQNDDGNAELDPEDYFNSILVILREVMISSKIDATEIICLGISCQRSTFITWDKITGETFHNLITWKDERANETG